MPLVARLVRLAAVGLLAAAVAGCEGAAERREEANFKRFESYARAMPPIRGQGLLYLIPVGPDFDFSVSIDGREIAEVEEPTASRFLVFSLPPGERKLHIESDEGDYDWVQLARPGETVALAVEAYDGDLVLHPLSERRARDILVLRRMAPARPERAYASYSNSLYRFLPDEDWW